MVISMFLLLENSSALELSLDSPSSIEINNEFQVEINLDSEETYDVKVFVHNSPDSGVTRNEYISKIFSTEKNTWQSSWNYLAGSYPKEKKYQLKVSESPGNRQVCARVRKTGANSSISKCNSILVSGDPTNKESDNTKNEDNNSELSDNLEGESNKKDEEEKELNNKDNEEKDNIQAQDNKNAKNTNPNSNNLEELSFSGNKQPTYENEEIILKSNKNANSDKIKDLENEVYATKKQKTTLSIFYIFNISLAFIIILIILKKYNV